MSAIANRLRRLEGGQVQPPSPERWPYSGGRIFKARTTIGTPQEEVDRVLAAAGCTDADLQLVFVSNDQASRPVTVIGTPSH